jgi:hypothetical protein
VGTRSALAPTRTSGARDARVLVLPSLPLRGSVDEDAAGVYDAAPEWNDDAECGGEGAYFPLATLPAPERADALDFTGFLSTIPAAALVTPAAPGRRAAPRRQSSAPGRVRQATKRLAEIGAIRPEVRIPGTVVPSRHAGDARAAVSGRLAKLPPLWLLANLAIVLAAGIAIVPRIVPADAAAGCQWHRVVPGDTLGNLGWANHTNAMAIARANHISNPNLIYVGQNLCIPLTSSAEAHSAPAVPAAVHPPTYGSAKGVQSFVSYALPYARQAHAQTGWPTSVILAQWGLEQGWRIPGYTGFNWGNVAALPGEPTVNGIAVAGSPAAFAYANTPQQGLNYYVRVAKLGYYQGVASAAANGADACARALGASPWDAGHYTATGSPGSSLLSIMRVYNLYWYDTH